MFIPDPVGMKNESTNVQDLSLPSYMECVATVRHVTPKCLGRLPYTTSGDRAPVEARSTKSSEASVPLPRYIRAPATLVVREDPASASPRFLITVEWNGEAWMMARSAF
jgi:hypothetical protein